MFFQGSKISRIVSYVKPEIENIPLQQVSGNEYSERVRDLDAPKLERKYKIGLLYCKEDQVEEKEMFNNVEGSPEYEEFLEFLGFRVTLASFEGFSGGLDVLENSSGTQSVYTQWEGAEIMFHVSTLLPYFVNDPQQLERKKHIGNDRVILVFKDGDTPFAPDSLHSKQNHIIGVVQPYSIQDPEGKRYYKFSVAAKTAVPPFGPRLNSPPIYERGAAFRNTLFSKLLNGYTATNSATEFRPLTMLFYKQKLNEAVSAFLSSWSPSLPNFAC